MKYSAHATKAAATAENTRLMELLGIPNEETNNYAVPEKRDGQWLIRVKERGPYKCDHLAVNVVALEEETPLP